MIFLQHDFKIRSITILVWMVVLFSCKTDIKEVNALATREGLPEMSGEDMELWYSDSARLKYRVIAPVYEKYNLEKEKYDEFPKGLKAILYDKEGHEVGSIVSRYAKKSPFHRWTKFALALQQQLFRH